MPIYSRHIDPIEEPPKKKALPPVKETVKEVPIEPIAPKHLDPPVKKDYKPKKHFPIMEDKEKDAK